MNSSLIAQVRALNALFKSNLGSFMSRLQGQVGSPEGPDSGAIEALLTDLDLVISNQKQLSDLIQRVKVHQRLSRELELTNDSIEAGRAAIMAILGELQVRDLQLARLVHECDEKRITMESILPITQNPQLALLAASRLALTCAAPAGWQPGAPLQPHRPPYPTEDLIRQSGLFALMSSSSAGKKDEGKVEETVTETASKASSTRVRRKAGASTDKAKLLDLDLS